LIFPRADVRFRAPTDKEPAAMPDLGTKHECLDCGTKFYDLGKPEAVCPKCGANQEELAAKNASPVTENPRGSSPKVEEPETDEVSQDEEDEELLVEEGEDEDEDDEDE
jgi:uncharacterized protein (TIGR02300 family)